jgi:hypothetical protein
MPEHTDQKFAYEPPAVVDRVPIDGVLQVAGSTPSIAPP